MYAEHTEYQSNTEHTEYQCIQKTYRIPMYTKHTMYHCMQSIQHTL